MSRWIILEPQQLWTKRRDVQHEYYKLKKKYGQIWSTHIEEMAAEQKQVSNNDEASHLHQKLSNEIQWERSHWLAILKDKECKKGVGSVEVECTVHDSNGNPVLNREISQATHKEQLDTKDEVEKVCLEEVANRISLLEDSPQHSNHLWIISANAV